MYDISQVPDCLTSGSTVQWLYVHYQYKLYQLMKERTLPNLPLGDIKDSVKWSSVFPGGTKARGQLSEKETHPRRTVTPKERGSLRHPHRSRSAVFLTLLTGWATVWTLKSARGMWQFYVPGAHDIFECQEHKLLFKDHETMSPVLEPHQSGLISSLVIATTPLLIRDGAPCFNYIYNSLHLTHHLL